MATILKRQKISCIPCRNRKTKCDGTTPCSRCTKHATETQCIYPKRRAMGRPPKNTTYFPLITRDELTCQKFIFEYTERLLKPQQGFHLGIEKIFSFHFQRGFLLKEKVALTNQMIDTKHIKMNNLLQQFSCLVSSLVNNLIKRSSQIQLESYFDPEITLASLIKNEHVSSFFFFHETIANPLLSLTPKYTLQLIDYFYQYQPYCILINKQQLLDDYWSDKVDPFLLSVICGTALYSAQVLEGKPLYLWEAEAVSKRNPFLNYCYVFLNMKLKETPTLAIFQAVIILGVFETMFGLPKHGMTMITLSYKMASDLGVFNNESLEQLDPIIREQLIMAYWTSFRITAYGCIELGLYVRKDLLLHHLPFPPSSLKYSVSYLYNNHNSRSIPSKSHLHYLYESYFTEVIITYFSARIYACIPKPQFNLFGHFSKLDTNDFIPFEKGQVESNIHTVLDSFYTFIQLHSHEWTALQRYTIESTYGLYSIHFNFIQPRLTSNFRLSEFPIRYLAREYLWTTQTTSKEELDLTDSTIVTRISCVLPIAMSLANQMEAFCKVPSYYNNDTSFLPLGIMESILETAVQLLLFQQQRRRRGKEKGGGLNIQAQIESIYKLTTTDIWKHHPTAKMIQNKLKNYVVVPKLDQELKEFDQLFEQAFLLLNDT